MGPFVIRFLAVDSDVFIGQLKFLSLRQPNSYTVVELTDQYAELVSHSPYHDNFESAGGRWKLWELTLSNEFDFRTVERMAKTLEADPHIKFAFAPDGIAPQIERNDFRTRP